MKQIVLPPLTDAQKYFVAKVLNEEGGMAWGQARATSERVPGMIYRTDNAELIQRIVAGLAAHKIAADVQDVGSREEAVDHPETTSVASSLLAAHPANAFRPRTVSSARVVAGIVCILLLVLLLGWTEELASAQKTGPQILQVYTRSAFYAVCIIGVTFGVYALTRGD